MRSALDYLEAAKLETVAEEMRAEGYDVRLNPGGGMDYDLVAEKPGWRVAVEVKVQERMREELEQLRALRRQARQSGFDEFRLIVVNRPREKQIAVKDLGPQLLAWIQAHPISEFSRLPFTARITRVSGLELDGISVDEDGMRLTGGARAAVELHPQETQNGTAFTETIPFQFTALLDGDRKLTQTDLRMDVSSLVDDPDAA